MKQTIILLHGLLGNLSNWKSVYDRFQNQFEIHIPVLPIFDENKENDLDYLVNFLDIYIKNKKLSNLTLIGNSLGGHVAVLYLNKFPQNVVNLVLTGSSGLYENNMLGSFPRRHDYEYIKHRVEYTFYNDEIASKELVDEVFDVVSDNRKCFQIIKTAKTTQRNYVTKELKEIQIPALLIWGEDDKITPPKVAEEFKELLPNAELYYINQCGHAPMMEKPLEFNNILESFFKKQKLL